MDDQLQLDTETLSDGVCCIRAVGVLDANTASKLDELITKALEHKHHKLVVDIEKITYIASAGVGVFVGCTQQCKDVGGGLVMLAPQAPTDDSHGLSSGFNPLEVFNLLGLTEHMAIARTLPEARQMLA